MPSSELNGYKTGWPFETTALAARRRNSEQSWYPEPRRVALFESRR